MNNEDVEQYLDDRIKGLERHRAGNLAAHPMNWRLHPQDQLDVLKHSINRFGVTTALLGYYSERNGGVLTILDGHARSEIDQDRVWPVLVLDIGDEEADTLILLLDPISGLAMPDAKNLLTLAANSDTVDPVLAAFCMKLAEASIVKTNPDQAALWPSVKIAVPPDVYQQWLQVVALYEGRVMDAFMSLLAAVGPVEGEGVDHGSMYGEVKTVGSSV